MNLSDIQSQVRDVNFLRVTASQYPDLAIKNSANRHYDAIFHKLLQSEGIWKVDNKKYQTDIVAGQKSYTLNIEWARVERVEASFSGSPNSFFPVVIPGIGQYSYPLQTTNTGNGYTARLENNTLLLPYAPTTTATGGLVIWVSERPVYMDLPTDEPRIERAFQIAILYGVAMDWCLGNDPAKLANFKTLYDEKIKEAETFYAQRNKGTARMLVREQDDN